MGQVTGSVSKGRDGKGKEGSRTTDGDLILVVSKTKSHSHRADDGLSKQGRWARKGKGMERMGQEKELNN